MSGSIKKRCSCGERPCSRLSERRHGTWELAIRLDTTNVDRHQLKRRNYETRSDAEVALDHIRQLVRLAENDDGMRRRIGDLVFERSRRGGDLPSVDEVRRRLGAGRDPGAPSLTMSELLDDFLASKRGIKRATYLGYRDHIETYLRPHLGSVPVDRLRTEHVAGLLDWFASRNAEIVAAKAEDRRVAPDPLDRRHRTLIIGVARQRQVVGSLRTVLNYAIKKRRLLDFNVAAVVELPTYRSRTPLTWAPDQVAAFLAATADDPLAVMWRLILLRGFRRGEALGLRGQDIDWDRGSVAVRQTVLYLDKTVQFGTPKTGSGERVVVLDAESLRLLRAHRKSQAEVRLATFGGWLDHDLIFCRADGTPIPPYEATVAFRRLAVAAGLPPIRLHDGRHTAASLALEAGVDVKVVSDQLGHATTKITMDLYQHVSRKLHADAAERIVGLLPTGERATGIERS